MKWWHAIRGRIDDTEDSQEQVIAQVFLSRIFCREYPEYDNMHDRHQADYFDGIIQSRSGNPMENHEPLDE